MQNKKIILGVASVWEKRKGLNDFIQLAGMLDDDYVIVLVGLSKKQIKQLPKNIIGKSRTNNSSELAEIYSAANVFVNPSVEETFGMTSLEAEACGTPSIVYQGTACEEVAHQLGNIAVEPRVENLYRAITGEKCPRGGATRHAAECRVFCLPHTNSASEIAGLYTTADLFVNPTYEDNYPTVNLEAQACGTRVVTYDVGGAKETIISTGNKQSL